MRGNTRNEMKFEIPIPESPNFLFVKHLEKTLRSLRSKGMDKITKIEVEEGKIVLIIE